MRFLCMPPAIAKYLALPKKEIDSSAGEELMEVDINGE